MCDWSREDRLVGAEIKSAVSDGRRITGTKIATITGLPVKVVAASLRRLLAALAIRIATPPASQEDTQ